MVTLSNSVSAAWTDNVAAMSVNKGCYGHPATTPALTVSPEGTQDGKARGSGRRSWNRRSQDRLQCAQTPHLPTRRQALSSLTWNVQFSLINSKLLMFWSPCFLPQSSYISWFLPCLFQAVPQSYSERLPSGLEVLRKSAEWNIALNF